MKRKFRPAKAFTLIELLIVIAIILILIAIALPNFIEAQMRARVTKVKGEFHGLEVALQSYRNDNPRYPFAEPAPGNAEPYSRRPGYPNGVMIRLVRELSTPVKYVTNVDYKDPFFANGFVDYNNNFLDSYFYLNYETFYMYRPDAKYLDGRPIKFEGWALCSLGPDIQDSGCSWVPIIAKQQGYVPGYARVGIYSPTNGTRSRGDLAWYSGSGSIPGEVAYLGK